MSGLYSHSEEIVHSVTHGLGAVLAAVGAAYLLQGAFSSGDPWRVFAVAVYGGTLLLLYTASALYHGVTTRGLKARLRLLDHSAIYLLIAGTYTPFLLLPLRGPWGWTLFAMVWGAAVAGIAYKLNFLDRNPRLSTGMYLAMGWLALVATIPILDRLEPLTLAWLLAGGLVYSFGTLVYHMRVPYAHVAWHLLVLVGSLCHFVAIAGL